MRIENEVKISKTLAKYKQDCEPVFQGSTTSRQQLQTRVCAVLGGPH